MQLHHTCLRSHVSAFECMHVVEYLKIKCDRACENRPCEHKKSPIFSVFVASSLNNYLYYCNKIFITTAEFNGLSSATYGNEIVHLEQKILAKI